MAYGNTNLVAQNKCGSTPAADTPKKATALEQHLLELRSLEKELYDIRDRTQRVADRLMGSEPSAIGEGKANDVKPAEPPMLMRMESSTRELVSLRHAISTQLQRLEQL